MAFLFESSKDRDMKKMVETKFQEAITKETKYQSNKDLILSYVNGSEKDIRKAIQKLVDIIKETIKDEDQTPKPKYFAMLMLRDSMQTRNKILGNYVVKKILKRLVIFAKHRKQSSDPGRGKDIFGTCRQEYEKYARDFLNVLLECLDDWGSNWPKAADGPQLHFKQVRQELIMQKVTLPKKVSKDAAAPKRFSGSMPKSPRQGPKMGPAQEQSPEMDYPGNVPPLRESGVYGGSKPVEPTRQPAASTIKQPAPAKTKNRQVDTKKVKMCEEMLAFLDLINSNMNVIADMVSDPDPEFIDEIIQMVQKELGNGDALIARMIEAQFADGEAFLNRLAADSKDLQDMKKDLKAVRSNPNKNKTLFSNKYTKRMNRRREERVIREISSQEPQDDMPAIPQKNEPIPRIVLHQPDNRYEAERPYEGQGSQISANVKKPPALSQKDSEQNPASRSSVDNSRNVSIQPKQQQPSRDNQNKSRNATLPPRQPPTAAQQKPTALQAPKPLQLAVPSNSNVDGSTSIMKQNKDEYENSRSSSMNNNSREQSGITPPPAIPPPISVKPATKKEVAPSFAAEFDSYSGSQKPTPQSLEDNPFGGFIAEAKPSANDFFSNENDRPASSRSKSSQDSASSHSRSNTGNNEQSSSSNNVSGAANQKQQKDDSRDKSRSAFSSQNIFKKKPVHTFGEGTSDVRIQSPFEGFNLAATAEPRVQDLPNANQKQAENPFESSVDRSRSQSEYSNNPADNPFQSQVHNRTPPSVNQFLSQETVSGMQSGNIIQNPFEANNPFDGEGSQESSQMSSRKGLPPVNVAVPVSAKNPFEDDEANRSVSSKSSNKSNPFGSEKGSRVSQNSQRNNNNREALPSIGQAQDNVSQKSNPFGDRDRSFHFNFDFAPKSSNNPFDEDDASSQKSSMSVRTNPFGTGQSKSRKQSQHSENKSVKQFNSGNPFDFQLPVRDVPYDIDNDVPSVTPGGFMSQTMSRPQDINLNFSRVIEGRLGAESQFEKQPETKSFYEEGNSRILSPGHAKPEDLSKSQQFNNNNSKRLAEDLFGGGLGTNQEQNRSFNQSQTSDKDPFKEFVLQNNNNTSRERESTQRNLDNWWTSNNEANKKTEPSFDNITSRQHLEKAPQKPADPIEIFWGFGPPKTDNLNDNPPSVSEGNNNLFGSGGEFDINPYPQVKGLDSFASQSQATNNRNKQIDVFASDTNSRPPVPEEVFGVSSTFKNPQANSSSIQNPPAQPPLPPTKMPTSPKSPATKFDIDDFNPVKKSGIPWNPFKKIRGPAGQDPKKSSENQALTGKNQMILQMDLQRLRKQLEAVRMDFEDRRNLFMNETKQFMQVREEYLNKARRVDELNQQKTIYFEMHLKMEEQATKKEKFVSAVNTKIEELKSIKNAKSELLKKLYAIQTARKNVSSRQSPNRYSRVSNVNKMMAFDETARELHTMIVSSNMNSRLSMPTSSRYYFPRA